MKNFLAAMMMATALTGGNAALADQRYDHRANDGAGIMQHSNGYGNSRRHSHHSYQRHMNRRAMYRNQLHNGDYNNGHYHR